MYFTFQCRHCGKDLKARDENTGANVRCPYCHTVIKVPRAQPGAAGGGPPPLPAGKPPAPDQAKPPEPKSGAAKTPAIRPEPAQPKTDVQQDVFANTNVSMLWTALIGLGLSVVFYLVVFPLRGRYVADVFVARGWVPYVEVFFMFWSVAILVLKSRKLVRQRETTLLDVLPGDLADDITPANLDGYLAHIDSLPVAPVQSFLVNRVWRGLEHFRLRRSNPEVAAMLTSQSEIDAAAVSSSYTLLNTFIWAIPILGFIGTVQGLGNAVSGFAGGLDKAQDIAVLKESLGTITLGLGVAFDTTLVALIMSLCLMFPTKSIQKAEDDLLNSIAEYCNENLLKRLNDGGAGTAQPEATDAQTLRQAIDAALAPHHAELQTWTKKLESIGGAITRDVSNGWNGIHQQLGPALEQLGRLQQDAARLQKDFVAAMQASATGLQSQTGRYQQDMASAFQSAASQMQIETSRIRQELTAAFQGAAGGAEGQLRALQQCAEEHQARINENLARVTDQIQQAMSGLAVRTGLAQEELSASMRAAGESLQASLCGLARGIDSLNGVLQSLGGEKVVIQMTASPRRRWFSFGRQDGA